jgi:hypothetical protein
LDEIFARHSAVFFRVRRRGSEGPYSAGPSFLLPFRYLVDPGAQETSVKRISRNDIATVRARSRLCDLIREIANPPLAIQESNLIIVS